MNTREQVTLELESARRTANNIAAVGDTDASAAIHYLADAIMVLLRRVERLTGEDK